MDRQRTGGRWSLPGWRRAIWARVLLMGDAEAGGRQDTSDRRGKLFGVLDDCAQPRKNFDFPAEQ